MVGHGELQTLSQPGSSAGGVREAAGDVARSLPGEEGQLTSRGRQRGLKSSFHLGTAAGRLPSAGPQVPDNAEAAAAAAVRTRPRPLVGRNPFKTGVKITASNCGTLHILTRWKTSSH